MFKQASNSTIRRHIAREVAQICSEVTEEVNMGTAKCKFQDKFTGDQEEILKKLDILAKRQLWMMKMLGRIYTSLRKVEESNLDKNQKYLQPVIERPVNPIDRPISSRSEFQDINGRLLDPGFRRQLASYLGCLGGRNTDDFVKRIFYALFDDKISLELNFKGRKHKECLCSSKLYEVIIEIYMQWNRGGLMDLCELEAAFTRRLKRSLDAAGKRLQRTHQVTNLNDQLPGPSPSTTRPPHNL
uniref:DUF4806 domain-containing protein n=1 Tax=Schistocephalus solidus TaxID=70667 RepID=A0A0X3NW89_SCHSO